jgi:hypothetical protein
MARDDVYRKEAFQDPARWTRIRDNARRWWNGELDRPLIQVVVQNAPTDRKPPRLAPESFQANYGLDVPPEDIIDRWDYDLSTQRFLGDAFPYCWPNFGPGVIASFLGGDMEINHDTVWFLPKKQQEIADIRWTYDSAAPWFNRIKDICRAAMRRWKGSVLFGNTDLGGNLDILSTFRPSERLLLDLVDSPEEVKRLTWDAHNLWWRYFEEIDKTLRPDNPGYSAWTSLYSEAPYYMLQCDFCYMIGPAMFDEFVKPELAASCKKLANAFYHLDGPGQLPHLDSLLRIKELKGVQWIPGSGRPDKSHWPEVYRKIHAAGKLMQMFDEFHSMDAVVEQIGTAKGIALIVRDLDYSQMKKAREFLKKYGVE